MKTTAILLAAVMGFCLVSVSASAQEHAKTAQEHHKTAPKHRKTKYRSEISKLKQARKTDHSTRQITVDPKVSPGKHADNASKTINHEINRESKDFNHFFQGKSKHKSKKNEAKPPH